MVGAGVDLASLKALLGHESLTTTQRYIHPGVDDLARAVASVEGL
jgi:site-specific recombinase XerD